MAASTTAFTYDYCQTSSGKNYRVGTISCSINGSRKAFDETAKALPILHSSRTTDTKTGLPTFTGYIACDLPYFEPQLVWKDVTYDLTAPLWADERQLCISVYVDGEDKVPILEYPVVASNEKRKIALSVPEGQKRRPLIFAPRPTGSATSPADRFNMPAGLRIDDLSSITVTVSHCEIHELHLADKNANKGPALSPKLAMLQKLTAKNVSHLVRLGLPRTSVSVPSQAQTANWVVRNKQPLANFHFLYKSHALLDTAVRRGVTAPSVPLAPSIPIRPALSASVRALDKLSLLDAKLRIRDATGILGDCKAASAALLTFTRAGLNADWETFQLIKYQRAAVESFFAFLPNQQTLTAVTAGSTHAGMSEDLIQMFEAITQVAEALQIIALLEIPLKQRLAANEYGFYDVKGWSTLPQTLQTLKQLAKQPRGGKVTRTSTQHVLQCFAKTTTGSDTTTRPSRKDAGVSNARARTPVRIYPDPNLGMSQDERSPARQTDSRTKAGSGSTGQTAASGKQYPPNAQKTASSTTRIANAIASSSGADKGSLAREASPEDVKPAKRPVIDLTEDDDEEEIARPSKKAANKQIPADNSVSNVRAVLSEIFAGQHIGEDILDIFAKSGFDASTEFAVFKMQLSQCHDKVKERFYGLLDEKMPLIPFGILMKRLE